MLEVMVRVLWLVGATVVPWITVQVVLSFGQMVYWIFCDAPWSAGNEPHQ